MIFVTHLAFRRNQRAGGRVDPTSRPYGGATSTVGAATIAAILVSTWWVPGLRVTILAGIPWLALLAVGYWFTRGPREKPGIGRPGKFRG
jgi:amino acid transporter, AAT family